MALRLKGSRHCWHAFTYITDIHSLNMTLIALVSAERMAMSKPLATSCSEKPRRWVISGCKLTALSASKLKHRGYCSNKEKKGCFQMVFCGCK